MKDKIAAGLLGVTTYLESESMALESIHRLSDMF